MRYTDLLFDMDGMLVDTTEGVLNCFRHAMKIFHVPPMNEEQLKRFMGPPLSHSFTKFCGLSEEETKVAIAVYRQRYSSDGQYECCLFPGVIELLQNAKEKGYRMCIATSKLEKYAVAIADRLGLSPFFADVVGSNESETISEKHEVIEEVIRRLQIDRRTALMIGDRKYDVLGAKKCGLDSFGVYMGCATPGEHEEAGATYIATGITELHEKLLSL